jgi:polyisoprenoid-binding protein YceI
MAWTVDPSHSSVNFSARHLMISTVRGRFTKFGGTLVLNEQSHEQSSAEGWVDIASVDTHDANRDGHLRSPDFFDFEKFPQMTFKSTRIVDEGEGQYKVTGNLTIKDVTREVTFKVTDEGKGKDPWGGTRWGFTAETTINRKDFGLNWNVALETGGWLVSDNIKLNIDVEAVLQPDQPAPQTTTAASAA